MQDLALAFDRWGRTKRTAKPSPVFTLDPFKLRAKARAKGDEATNEAESFNLLHHDYNNNNNNNFDSQDLTVDTTTALARELEEPPPPYLQTRKATMPPERERDPELAERHSVESDCVDTACCRFAYSGGTCSGGTGTCSGGICSGGVCMIPSPRRCAVFIIVLVFLGVVGFVLWAWSPQGQRAALPKS